MCPVMFEQASQAINKSMCLPKAFPAFVHRIHIDLNIFVNIHRFLYFGASAASAALQDNLTRYRARVWRIYLNIRIYWSQIFGHLFVSIFLLQIYLDILLYQICLYGYIRTFQTNIQIFVQFSRRIFGHSFVSNFLIQIYSYIRSCKFFYSNIFVSKFSRIPPDYEYHSLYRALGSLRPDHKFLHGVKSSKGHKSK